MSEGVWHQDAQSEGRSRNEDGRLVGRAPGDVGSSSSSEQQLVESAMGHLGWTLADPFVKGHRRCYRTWRILSERNRNGMPRSARSHVFVLTFSFLFSRPPNSTASYSRTKHRSSCNTRRPMCPNHSFATLNTTFSSGLQGGLRSGGHQRMR